MRDNVLDEIREIAMKYNIQKVILFGSRARGDYLPTSDYDFAIIAEDLSVLDKAIFCADVEEINTLKKIDIVFVDSNTSNDLMKNIKRDGVIIYE